MNEQAMKILEAALTKGAKMHAFLSGGGLRVVRLEDKRLVGYGEHPSIEEALRHTAEDYAAGGRPYAEVYGKMYDHYLTGSPTPSSELDACVRQGRTFDARADGAEYVVELNGLGQTKIPEDVKERALAGETVQWMDRGYTYESAPTRFANGEPCVSTSVVAHPEGGSSIGSWHFDITQTGRAARLVEAFAEALRAKAVEVGDGDDAEDEDDEETTTPV